MLEDVVRKGRLLDLYGPLLTEKQRRCMEMYFDMDLSLSEIGEELNISRQGAYDMLKRASQSLEKYEQRLHLLARYDVVRGKIDEAEALLDREEPEKIESVKKLLHEIEL
ncbi:YlxM family DNA-binding protein [uncultured Megasphaera sp.]|uniref:YlxM family DNA-binding protein n=1 Tax=uncultured Megasphaera sp. TaxID=165188 RepID=UPI0025DFC680|nr:sigma factor-like helix-turn-helix DNA-binding protein [uncultured Megasphaera sp.]